LKTLIESSSETMEFITYWRQISLLECEKI